MTALSYTRSWARAASSTCNVGSIIAPSAGCPSIAARTRAGNWLRKPLGSTRPNVFRMPRTQFLQRRNLRHDLGACYQQCTHGLAVEALHRHLAVPADAHDLRQTEGVVGVGLVDLQRQRRLGVARIHADHGEASLFQPVEQPVRQLPAFEADPNRMGRVLRHGRYDGFRRRIDLAAPHDLVGIVDDADRRLLQGHIEADILVTLGHGLAPLALRGNQPVPAVVTPRLRHVPASRWRFFVPSASSLLLAPGTPRLRVALVLIETRAKLPDGLRL